MAQSQVPASQTFATQVPAHNLAGERTFTRTATFEKPLKLAVDTVAADGTDKDDATPLPDAPVVIVSGADGSKGVILPAAVPAGYSILIYGTADAVLKVYPHAGGDINEATDDAALDLTGRKLALFVRVNAETWAALFDTDTLPES